MNRARVVAVLAALIASQAQAARSPPVVAPEPTVEDAKPGYWFYKKEPEPEEEAATEESPKQKPMTAPPSEQALLAMPVKQVEKMIEDYREYALFTMQPQHVTWYYQMVDFARRRSRAFMNVSEVVMLGNPTLNMNSVYPTNAPGTNARVAQREATITSRLRSEQSNAALVMLTSRGCGFCEAQRGILKYFRDKYGWQIREVDIAEHPEAVTRFGTTTTPSTFLIVKGISDWQPIAVGVESLPKVEENTYRGIRLLRGETSPQQWTTNEYEDGGLLDPQRK